MAKQLWGTYSVADHCSAFPFVADLILYDRLIVPVPPADEAAEWERWEKRAWKPRRQQLLLGELGDYVRTVPWSKELREKWSRMGGRSGNAPDEQGAEADTGNVVSFDVDLTARAEREVRQGGTDGFGDTRHLIARQQGSALLDGADARVLTAYGAPDRFDRHWRFTRQFPFLTRRTTVQRADDVDFLPADVEAQREHASRHELATLIVGKFVLPIAPDEASTETDDSRAREVLLRARELLDDPHVAPKREAFRAWVAEYDALKLPDRRKAEEFDELLRAYNEAVLGKRGASRVESGMIALNVVSAGASVCMPLTGVVGPVVGGIATVVTRRAQPDDWQPGDLRAAALISEASEKLRGE